MYTVVFRCLRPSLGLVVPQITSYPFRSCRSIFLVVKVCRSDDACSIADPIEHMADNMNLGAGNIAHRTAVIRITENED